MYRNSWNIDVSVDESFRHVYIHIYSIYIIYRSRTWSYVWQPGAGGGTADTSGRGHQQILFMSAKIMMDHFIDK